MNQWTKEQTKCLNGESYALPTGGRCANTIKVARVLCEMLESMMLTPGRHINLCDTYQKGKYHIGLKATGGNMAEHEWTFKSRKEQCDFLRDKINGK